MTKEEEKMIRTIVRDEIKKILNNKDGLISPTNPKQEELTKPKPEPKRDIFSPDKKKNDGLIPRKK